MTDVAAIECVFSAGELDRRLAATRGALAAAGIDVAIVTGPENIFYLTGQQTPGYYTFQALMLPAEGAPVFLLRQLEQLNCRANTRLSDFVVYQDDESPADAVVRVLADRGWSKRRIGVEKRGWFLPIRFFEQLQDAVAGITDSSGIVEGLRAVKSAEEIAFIETAAGYAAAGMRAGLAAVRPGATENDVVAAMFQAAVAAGSEYFGMEPLVSSGPRTGVPHGTWRRRRLEAGEPMFLELAGVHNRYHAALMRSAWLGTPPAEAVRMAAVCEEALAAAIDAVRPGATCEAVHRACQAVIDRNGLTEAYRKRTGYSIGTSFAPDWGEGNILSLYYGQTRAIEPGMVFHIPPALRVYGAFTVGVSETVVVTDTGCRPLSDLDRSITLIG
ncbi:MAG: aminopeptidase P family protein [Rhodospirillaceae bacterium]|nr:aminopeptidase P family protein [Rhodospirillaceae bacterium]